MAYSKMAALRWSSRQFLHKTDKQMLIIRRSFTCTPILEQLLKRFMRKPEKRLHKKPQYMPWRKVVEKPRDDVYFLKDQDPPSHNFQEALDVLRAYAFTDETVVVHLKLNVLKEKKIRPEATRGTLLLPKPFKPIKILVFAEGELAANARQAGAEIVGGKELIPKVEAGEYEFDYCLSSLDFLPNLSHMPKILRDKMPNTRRGTATDELDSAVSEYRRGHSYKSSRSGTIHSELGLLSFTNNEIRENIRAFIAAIESHKPESVKKENYFKQFILKSKYGPGLRMHHEELDL